MKEQTVANFIYYPEMKGQALAVLAILSTAPLQNLATFNKERFAYDYLCRTSAWHNGREQGFILTVQPGGDKAIHIVVSESRNSDALMVWNWVSHFGMNSPTVADFSDEIYYSGRGFDELDIKGSTEYIIELIRNFFTELKSQ